MSSLLEASQWNRILLVSMVILHSDFSKICLGLKSSPGDNGGISGLEVEASVVMRILHLSFFRDELVEVCKKQKLLLCFIYT